MNDSIDLQDQLNAVQELLTDVMLALAERRRNSGRKVRITSNGLARELGVNAGSLNQWINGNRLPNYQNAVLLSQHPLIGGRIFEILGFDKPNIPANAKPSLLFVVDNWGLLNEQDQELFFTAVKERLNGRKVRFVFDGEGDNAR